MLDENGVKVKSNLFPHLSDFIPLASLKAKSSSHFTIAQIVKIVINNFFEAGIQHKIFLPADPEFVLEAIVYMSVLGDMTQHMIFTVPPFHVQKHCMESLEKNFVFMRAIKIPFANAIGFKPSVFNGLVDRIENSLAKVSDMHVDFSKDFEFIRTENMRMTGNEINQDRISETISDDIEFYQEDSSGIDDEILSSLNDEQISTMICDEILSHVSGPSEIKIKMRAQSNINANIVQSIAKLIGKGSEN